VELRHGLHVAIQPLLQLLRDEDRHVRSAAASAFGRFAEQRESWPDIIATSLIQMNSGAS
jgi:HEAT repeat protein